MGLNKLTKKSNMYNWITATWNPIKGKCSHDCAYCSLKSIAKRFNKPQKPIHLDEKELKTNLGEGNIIFVGSSTDMFASNIPAEWIVKVLQHCRTFHKNKYLFQSKNPSRMLQFRDEFPETDNCIWGTTIETNKHICEISKAPPPIERTKIKLFPHRMVTIEPIMRFEIEPFIKMIKDINPEWVNIGADSKHSGLTEPSKEDIEALITELEKFTEVRKKSNLKRLIEGDMNDIL